MSASTIQTSSAISDAFLEHVARYGREFDFSQEATIVLPVLWNICNEAWPTLDEATKQKAEEVFTLASAKVFWSHAYLYATFGDPQPSINKYAKRFGLSEQPNVWES